MAGLHPHDALLDRLNEELYQARKMFGMWGGTDWYVIDADPEAIVIQVATKKDDPASAVLGPVDVVQRHCDGVLGAELVRAWARRSGSTDEPQLHEFPLVSRLERIETSPEATAEIRRLWAACEALGWERGTQATARPERTVPHRVIGGAFAAPPLPKPVEEMSQEEVLAWSHDWAVRIFRGLGLEEGGR